MSKRVSPTERLRAEIDEVFAGGENLSRAIERVAQLGAQLLCRARLRPRWPHSWGGTAMSGPRPVGTRTRGREWASPDHGHYLEPSK